MVENLGRKDHKAIKGEERIWGEIPVFVAETLYVVPGEIDDYEGVGIPPESAIVAMQRLQSAVAAYGYKMDEVLFTGPQTLDDQIKKQTRTGDYAEYDYDDGDFDFPYDEETEAFLEDYDEERLQHLAEDRLAERRENEDASDIEFNLSSDSQLYNPDSGQILPNLSSLIPSEINGYDPEGKIYVIDPNCADEDGKIFVPQQVVDDLGVGAIEDAVLFIFRMDVEEVSGREVVDYETYLSIRLRLNKLLHTHEMALIGSSAVDVSGLLNPRADYIGLKKDIERIRMIIKDLDEYNPENYQRYLVDQGR